MADFIGAEITIPENLQVNLQGIDTLLQFANAPMKMVIWYDSVGCSSCQIQHIHDWNDIVLYANSIGKSFGLVFIFSPKASDLNTVRIALRTADFEYPVYIDNENLFHKKIRVFHQMKECTLSCSTRTTKSS